MQADARELIAQIEADAARVAGFYGHQRDLPAFAKLVDEPLEVKQAILDHFLEHQNLIKPSDIFPHLKLGTSIAECKLRQQALQHMLAMTNGLDLLTCQINRFSPTDLEKPVLLQICRRIASERAGDFADFLEQLHGYRASGPCTLTTPLALSERQELIATWLCHTKPLTSIEREDASGIPEDEVARAYTRSFDAVRHRLGQAQVPDTAMPPLPAFLQSLKSELDVSSATWGEQDPMAQWLEFSAAFLATATLTAAQENLLIEAYRDIACYPDHRFRFCASQVIGRAANDSQASLAMFSAMRQFDRPAMGVVFYAAATGDLDLISRFSRILTRRPGAEDRSLSATTAHFIEFAASHVIGTASKHRLLAIGASACEVAADPVATCIEMMQSLGTIASVLNAQCQDSMYEVYRWWLARFTDMEILVRACKPDQEFLQTALCGLTIEGRVDIKALLADLYPSSADGDEPNRPVKTFVELPPRQIDTSTVISWVGKALEVWSVETRSVSLADRTKYLLREVLGNHHEATLLDVPEIAENCPLLVGLRDLAQELDDEGLLDWTDSAAMLMLAVDPMTRQSAFFASALTDASKFRSDSTRLSVTMCLYFCFRESVSAGQFARFCQPAPVSHARIFQAPLYLLAQQGIDRKVVDMLALAVKNRAFKDTNRAIPLLEFLSTIATANTVDHDLKNRILEQLLSRGGVGTPAMMVEILHVQALLKLSQTDAPSSEQARMALQAMPNEENFESRARTVLQLLFALSDADSASLASRYIDCLHAPRELLALIAYATNLNVGLTDAQEKTEVIAETALMLQGFLALDSDLYFGQIRYDCVQNVHNAKLAELAPAAWARWPEEVRLERQLDYQPSDLENKVNLAQFIQTHLLESSATSTAWFPTLQRLLEKNMSREQALAYVDAHLVASTHVEAHQQAPVGIENATPGLTRDLAQTIEHAFVLALAPGNTNRASLACLEALPATLPHSQVRDHIETLIGQLKSPPLDLAKCRSMSASISGRAQDLFAIAFEGRNSCQHIYGKPDLSKALPGYILDGKYLTAQIKNGNGTLMCRRLLRLMWSEKQEKPVILIEAEYASLGVPRKLRAAVISLVHQKAQAMGALVATKDKTLVQRGDNLTDPLFAYASPRPNEYVDALRGQEHHGDYCIKDAWLLDAPPQEA